MAYPIGRGSPVSNLAFVVVCALLFCVTLAQGSPSFSLQERAREDHHSSPFSFSNTITNAVSPSPTNTSSDITSVTSPLTNFTTTSTTTTLVNSTTTSTTVTSKTTLTANETTSTSSLTITSTSSSVITSSSSSSTEKSSTPEQLKISSSSATSSTLLLLTSIASSTSSVTSETDVPSPTDPVQNIGGATTNGFWSNKSAVAGTFTVVSLIIVGILAGLFTCLMKRNNRYKDNYGEYERYPEPDMRASSHNPPSPGMSTSELDHAPMDPFADPQNYYNFGIYDQAAAHSTDHSSHSHSIASHDDPFSTAAPQIVPASSLTSVTTLTPGHPYANARDKLAPVSFKDPVSRDSYQPSIDSFYGAGNTLEHAGHAV